MDMSITLYDLVVLLKNSKFLILNINDITKHNDNQIKYFEMRNKPEGFCCDIDCKNKKVFIGTTDGRVHAITY